MEKLSGLRTVLICLIVMHGLWFMIGALGIINIQIYDFVPPAMYSLLSTISNAIEIVFYVLLLAALPTLARARD